MSSFAGYRGVGRELAQVLLHERGLQWLLEIVSDWGRVARHLTVVRSGVVLRGGGDRVRNQVDAAYTSAVQPPAFHEVDDGARHAGSCCLHNRCADATTRPP